MTFLTANTLIMQETVRITDRVRVDSNYRARQRKHQELRPAKVVQMGAAVPSSVKKSREEISELERDYPW